MTNIWPIGPEGEATLQAWDRLMEKESAAEEKREIDERARERIRMRTQPHDFLPWVGHPDFCHWCDLHLEKPIHTRKGKT